MRKLFFTLTLFFTLFARVFAQGSDVIEPELLDAMSHLREDEKISVNIIMKAQFDAADLQARASIFTDKKARRSFAVKEIKDFTERSQQDLMLTINALKANNLVEKVQSRWLANAINCLATKDVIYAIAQRPDVLIIGHDRQHNVLFDEQPKPVIPMRGMTQNVTMVNADDVWNLGFTGEGVIVAVVDTGVNYNHLDVQDHLWDGGAEFPHHGYDTYNNDNDPMDEMGHGSHCAGTVCGDGSAGTQTGMAPDATLMCVKVLDANGNGGANTICAGVDFAVEHGADIFSMSLGIPASTNSEKILFRNTMVNALATGIVGAVAAGNEGYYQYMYPVPNNVRCPGSCPPPWIHPDQEQNSGELSCVVCVGAVNYYDNAADFTSEGPVTWQNISGFQDYPYNPGIGLIRPDVCAPGVGIISLNYMNTGGYVEMDGTSMATPCVAGVMALIMSKAPNITPAEMDFTLETTGVALTSNKSNITGSCRVDALAATESVTVFPITLDTYVMKDSLGNDNGKLNPGETIWLNTTYLNETDEPVYDVIFKLVTDNQYVTFVDNQANLDFQANELKIVDDAFAFRLADDAPGNSNVDFSIMMIHSSDTSYYDFSLLVYDYLIHYNGLTINDEQGNDDGEWNPGESVQLNIFVDNAGNEPSWILNGILSTDNEFVTITKNESLYPLIPAEMVSCSYYEATLSEEATSEVVNFSLLMTDGNGRQTLLEVSTETAPQCKKTIRNLNYEITENLDVILSWNKPAGTPTPTSYDVYRDTTLLANTNSLTLTDNGVEPGSYNYTIFANYSSYSNVGLVTVVNAWICDTVTNLRYSQNPDNNEYMIISWDRPLNDFNLVGYDVYKDSVIIASLQDEDYSYIIEKEPSTTHNYCVQALYDGCEGDMSCLEISICGIIENLTFQNDDKNVTASWQLPENNTFTYDGFVISIDDVVVDTIGEMSYTFEHEYGDVVFSLYPISDECVESTTATFEMTFCDLNPVEGLTTSLEMSYIRLNWNANEYNTGYNVYRDNVLIANAVQDTSYNDSSFGENGIYCYTVTSLCDSLESLQSDSSCVNVNIGIDEQQAEKVNIYPNPSNDRFFIESNSMKSITIYDTKGVVVKEVIVNADKYEIYGLTEGIYFLNVQTKSGAMIKRIIKL